MYLNTLYKRHCCHLRCVHLMNCDIGAFCWCFTFKADLVMAILCRCLPEIKAMSPPPTCQGHTHHRFTGLSSQVMHGFYSQSVSGSINNKLCEAAANSSPLRPVNPCSATAPTHTGFTWCEHTINSMFSFAVESLIRCLGSEDTKINDSAEFDCF